LYNWKVQLRPIGKGDLVLRKAKVSDPRHSRGKLASRWEGSYRVTRVLRDGIYTLAALDGEVLPRTWHASNFKKFYV
ncbi:hypothetical protein BHE74_00018225, partial [Ensete ventricosum]